MSIKDAVASCLMQYASTRGRASRSEFWLFVLVIAVCSFALYIAGFFLPEQAAPTAQALLFIAAALPLFSVFVRRMHDIGASGTRSLVFLIPVVHFVCLYWAAKAGDQKENAFGPVPQN